MKVILTKGKRARQLVWGLFTVALTPSAWAAGITLSAGLVNIDNSHSYSTEQRNELGHSIGTASGLVPSRFNSPGTEQTIGGAIKPILTLSYHMTDNWSVVAVGGIPPKLDVNGHGRVSTPGVLNKIVPAVEMGKPANNPVATVRHWYPSVMLQYRFGQKQDRFRPFVSAGLGYSFFTDVKLSPNFDNNLHQVGRFLALSTTLDPSNSTEAKASSAFRPIFDLGVSYRFDEHWGMAVSVAYVPIKTVATIHVRDKTGKVVLTSQADLDIPTIATSATIARHF